MCYINSGLANRMGKKNTARIWSQLYSAAMCIPREDDYMYCSDNCRRKPCGARNKERSCSCPPVTKCNIDNGHGTLTGPTATVLPIGQAMVEKIIQHFIDNNDTATAAAIVCVFTPPKRMVKTFLKRHFFFNCKRN